MRRGAVSATLLATWASTSAAEQCIGTFSTDCAIESSGCVASSKNFPNNYSNHEECHISTHGGCVHFEVHHFDTESGRDYLEYSYSNGTTEYFSGDMAPPSGSFSGKISWSSDDATSRSGWLLCPQYCEGTWISDCPVDPDDENCVTSRGYPGLYENDESCDIWIEGCVHMEVVNFTTEENWDFLSITDEDGRTTDYHGVVGPPGGMTRGHIHWETDGSITEPGWKFCFPPPERPQPSPRPPSQCGMMTGAMVERFKSKGLDLKMGCH